MLVVGKVRPNIPKWCRRLQEKYELNLQLEYASTVVRGLVL